MQNQYGDCYFCGGAIEERLMAREVHWQGELLIFENVPVGVCVQCGERVLLPDVAQAIDRSLQARTEPTKTIQVPVYEFESIAV
ncbi:MAG: YgiT-type zinc finger protein [Chloroflexi bacterium]|nr:YgiT-type zinc finger protein [Chloroflexota bacterium]